MTNILDKCVCVCDEIIVPVHTYYRYLLCTCAYGYTIRHGSCTDGLVYLVFCINDRYKLLLFSLVYVVVVYNITTSVQIGDQK